VPFACVERVAEAWQAGPAAKAGGAAAGSYNRSFGPKIKEITVRGWVCGGRRGGARFDFLAAREAQAWQQEERCRLGASVGALGSNPVRIAAPPLPSPFPPFRRSP
jgi:hypothetical protein